MHNKKGTIDEADLHAYVDGLLDEERRRAVGAYLRVHEEARREVEHDRAVNRGLHALYDGVLAEVVPDRLRQRPRASLRPLRRAILPIAALALGLLIGWVIRDQTGSAPSVDWLVRDAVNFHSVYAAATQPAELTTDEPERLAGWLAERLNEPLAVPRLHAFGYELAGARLLSGYDGPAVQFLYRGEKGTGLTLFVLRSDGEREEIEPQRVARADWAAVYWIDEGLACALVADAGAADLPAAAASAYRQLTGSEAS